MFSFTTTTIINSDKDTMSDKALYSFLAKDAKHEDILKIKRDFTFEKPYVKKIYKKEASKWEACELELNCTNLLKLIPENSVYPISGRINLYVSLEGSEESIFANDFYQKGHPFSFGFLLKNKTATAAELAKQIETTVNKFNVADIGRKVFEVSTAEEGTVSFKGTSEYTRFKAASIFLDNGIEETNLVHFSEGDPSEQDVLVVKKRGKNGFGTYSHLLKDLRLPTLDSLRWGAVYSEDRPVPGAMYNQYIIYYKAPSLTNPSLAAVGHATETETTHVFWVRQDLDAGFSAVMQQFMGADAAEDPKAVYEKVVDKA